MAETFYSPVEGTSLVEMRMYVHAGASYAQAFEFFSVNPDDTDEAVNEWDFTNWNIPAATLAVSSGENSAPIFTLTGAANEINLQGAGTEATLLIRMSPTTTKLLQTAGLRRAFGWLEAVDQDGNTQRIAVAHIYAYWEAL